MSGVAGDREKSGIRVQRVWRTQARTSEKVGTVLAYRAARRGRKARFRRRWWATRMRQPRDPAGPGGGAGDGRRRPRAPSFHAQVGVHLLERGLHLPVLQVRGEDGGRGPVGVGAEQGGVRGARSGRAGAPSAGGRRARPGGTGGPCRWRPGGTAWCRRASAGAGWSTPWPGWPAPPAGRAGGPPRFAAAPSVPACGAGTDYAGRHPGATGSGR